MLESGERDAAEATGDLRAAFMRNVQSLQALQANDPTPSQWHGDAASLLREHRELMRVEWRDADLRVHSFVDTPFRAPVVDRVRRSNQQSEVLLACSTARRARGAGGGS